MLGNQNPGTVPSISERECNPELKKGNKRPRRFKRLIQGQMASWLMGDSSTLQSRMRILLRDHSVSGSARMLRIKSWLF